MNNISDKLVMIIIVLTILFVFATGLVITNLPHILNIYWFNLFLDYMIFKFMKSIENNFDNPKVNTLLRHHFVQLRSKTLASAG